LSKLTNNNVNEIRLMLSNGIYQRIIAEKFNVSQAAISLINRNINWAV
jgi:hypothetical protein